MKAPSKIDQLRALRERKFTEQQERAPAPRPALLASAPSPNASPNIEAKPARKTSGASRNARWRENNREKYNAGMRDLMRKKRASEKD